MREGQRTRVVVVLAAFLGALPGWGCTGGSTPPPPDASSRDTSTSPDVGPPDTGGGCTAYWRPSMCPEGEWCLPDSSGAEEGACVVAGPGGEHAPCTAQSDCAADLVCTPLGTCETVCRVGVGTPWPGATCVAAPFCVSVDVTNPEAPLGFCAPHCTPFEAEGCGEGSWCQPLDAYYEGGVGTLENYRLVGGCAPAGGLAAGEACDPLAMVAEERCVAGSSCEGFEGHRCHPLCRPSGMGGDATACPEGLLCLNPTTRFRDVGQCLTPCDLDTGPDCPEGFRCLAAETLDGATSDYCWP